MGLVLLLHKHSQHQLRQEHLLYLQEFIKYIQTVLVEVEHKVLLAVWLRH
jgi:hypothetical protein